MLGIHLPHVLQNQTISALLQFVFTLPIIAVNFRYFTVGFKNLFRGAPNMDTLIALSATASQIYSMYNTFLIIRGNAHPHLYYESAAMILSLITLGKFFEGISKKKWARQNTGLIPYNLLCSNFWITSKIWFAVTADPTWNRDSSAYRLLRNKNPVQIN